MKIARWLAPALLAAVVGCGKSEVTQTDAPSTSTGPTVAQESPGEVRAPTEDRDSYKPSEPIVNAPAAVLPVTASSSPGEVVTEFLSAMKTSNEGVAAGLLTETARVETAKHQLAVQPPGSATAEYQVGESEISAEDPTLAQVACVWIEKDETGASHQEQVIWVLRKGSEGWRVCGMATQMPTREEPVFFDFENPAEMTALMEQIGQEMEAAANQVADPTDTTEAPALRAASEPGEEANSLR